MPGYVAHEAGSRQNARARCIDRTIELKGRGLCIGVAGKEFGFALNQQVSRRLAASFDQIDICPNRLRRSQSKGLARKIFAYATIDRHPWGRSHLDARTRLLSWRSKRVKRTHFSRQ